MCVCVFVHARASLCKQCHGMLGLGRGLWEEQATQGRKTLPPLPVSVVDVVRNGQRGRDGQKDTRTASWMWHRDAHCSHFCIQLGMMVQKEEAFSGMLRLKCINNFITFLNTSTGPHSFPSLLHHSSWHPNCAFNCILFVRYLSFRQICVLPLFSSQFRYSSESWQMKLYLLPHAHSSFLSLW